MSELINIKDLFESPLNPRTHFDDRALVELADSIRSMGLLQPLVVRLKKARGKSRKFEIICGHRRFRACQIVGLAEVPCEVREMTDVDAVIAALIENAQRADVSPLDESRAVGRLTDAGLEDVPELAVKLGRTTRWVKDRLRLRGLIPELAALLDQQVIPLGGAMVLAVLTAAHQAELVPELSRPRQPWESALTVAAVRNLATKSAKDISRAPWRVDEPGIGGEPACTGCPKQTGAQADLFGENEDSRCMDGACWALKLRVWVERQRQAGVAVREGSHYDEPSTHAIVNNKPGFTDRSWGDIAPRAPRTIWLDEWGQITTTVRYEDVADALDAAGERDKAATVREFYMPSTWPKPQPAPSFAETKKKVGAQLDLVLSAPKLAPPPGLPDDVVRALLECAIRGARSEELEFVAWRRVKKEKGLKPEAELRFWAAELATDAHRWGALVELLAARAGLGHFGGTAPGLEVLAALAGVEVTR